MAIANRFATARTTHKRQPVATVAEEKACGFMTLTVIGVGWFLAVRHVQNRKSGEEE
jgi:hypothetical protein